MQSSFTHTHFLMNFDTCFDPRYSSTSGKAHEEGYVMAIITFSSRQADLLIIEQRNKGTIERTYSGGTLDSPL
jgi:hypothetical protein